MRFPAVVALLAAALLAPFFEGANSFSPTTPPPPPPKNAVINELSASYLDSFEPPAPRASGGGATSYLDTVGGPGRVSAAASAGGSGGGPTSYLDSVSGVNGKAVPPSSVPPYPPPAPAAQAATAQGAPRSYLDSMGPPAPRAAGGGMASYLDSVGGPGRVVSSGGGSSPSSYLDSMGGAAAPPASPATGGEAVPFVTDVEKGNKWYRGTISSKRTVNVYEVSYADGDVDINLPEDALRPRDGRSELEVGTDVEVLSWEDRFGPFSE